MGRFYGERIKSGEITLDEVPRLWKTITEKWIKNNT